jgi:hypothetical protein
MTNILEVNVMGRYVNREPSSIEEFHSHPPFVPFHSVEIAIDGLAIPYQFKIWQNPSMPMCLLVREDSEIVSRLREGDVLNMRYYSEASKYPTEHMETEILQIEKNREGRYKGHYWIALGIKANGKMSPMDDNEPEVRHI